MNEPVSIWLVDDHPFFLSGLRTLIQANPHYRVTHEALSAENLLEQAQTTPHVVLADVQLPGLQGPELCKKLKTLFRQVKVVAITSHDDPRVIKQMMRSGADGYLLKTVHENELFGCLAAVLRNETYVQESLRLLLVEQSLGKNVREKSPLPRLTPREKDILALIVAGDTTADIATKLFISVATVETHRMNLFQKLHVKNVAGLVREALQNNLLD